MVVYRGFDPLRPENTINDDPASHKAGKDFYKFDYSPEATDARKKSINAFGQKATPFGEENATSAESKSKEKEKEEQKKAATQALLLEATRAALKAANEAFEQAIADADRALKEGKIDGLSSEEAANILLAQGIITVDKSYRVGDSNNSSLNFKHAVHHDANGFYYTDIEGGRVSMSPQEIAKLRRMVYPGEAPLKTVEESGDPEVIKAAHALDASNRRDAAAWRKAGSANDQKIEATKAFNKVAPDSRETISFLRNFLANPGLPRGP